MIDVDFVQFEQKSNPSLNSLLIIGKGDSTYKNNQIVYPSNLIEVQDMFGIDSELTIAYKEAKIVGAPEVFLCNCYRFTDYVSILDLIAQGDFAYVAPLIDFNTTFVDSETKKEEYIGKLYSDALAYTFSSVFFTSKHASLFENIEHFLNTMKSCNYDFKDKSINKLDNGENLCFVLNNLKDYKYANVALASLIAISDLRYYPQKDFGECVFDIRAIDCFDHEFAFFQYDDLAKTTIENLLNYYGEPAPEKMLLISLMKNKINNALDYSQFSGRLINAYTKIELENYTKQILQSFIGKLIEKFSINDIKYFKEKTGEVNIVIYITIKPYHSIEELKMEVEI